MSQACSLELSLAPLAPLPRDLARGGDDRARAPGWFDSSFELQRGLEVREGWSDDERVRSWVDDFLRAQRSVGRTASPSAITAIA